MLSQRCFDLNVLYYRVAFLAPHHIRDGGEGVNYVHTTTEGCNLALARVQRSKGGVGKGRKMLGDKELVELNWMAKQHIKDESSFRSRKVAEKTASLPGSSLFLPQERSLGTR